MPAPYRSNRRPSRRPRPAADPILMGEPSPALTKIARMNTQKLTAHIQTMVVEAQRLGTKIENLSGMETPDQEKIKQLTDHRNRIVALIKAARERLEGKLERKKQYAQRGTSGGGYR